MRSEGGTDSIFSWKSQSTLLQVGAKKEFITAYLIFLKVPMVSEIEISGQDTETRRDEKQRTSQLPSRIINHHCWEVSSMDAEHWAWIWDCEQSKCLGCQLAQPPRALCHDFKPSPIRHRLPSYLPSPFSLWKWSPWTNICRVWHKTQSQGKSKREF